MYRAAASACIIRPGARQSLGARFRLPDLNYLTC